MPTSRKKKPVLRRAAHADTPEVRGLHLDPQTRCLHHHTHADVIAIKMKCCAAWYACKDCHIALAGHAIEVWPRSEWNQRAILCGACGARPSISPVGARYIVPSSYLVAPGFPPVCGGPGDLCREAWHFVWGCPIRRICVWRLSLYHFLVSL